MKITGLKLVVWAITMCCCANVFSADYFDPLFRAAKVKGNVYVLRPGDTEPILIKEDFRYPYGSKIIVNGIDPKLSKKIEQKNEVMLIFANDYQIRLGMDTVVTTEKSVVDGNAKVAVGIEKGVVSTFITLPKSKTGDEVEDAKIDAKLNAFVVKTPITELNRLVDRNEIRVGTDAAGLVKSRYKIESGSVNLEGQQFKIIRTRNKTVFEISGDAEFTRIGVQSGEITASINRGEDTPYQGSFKQNSQIKLWRLYTQIEKKLAVAVMITSPDGKVERFEYIENPSTILKSLQGKGEELVAVADETATDSEDFVEETTESTDETITEETSDTSFDTEESTEDDTFGGDDFFSDDSWDF